MVNWNNKCICTYQCRCGDVADSELDVVRSEGQWLETWSLRSSCFLGPETTVLHTVSLYPDL